MRKFNLCFFCSSLKNQAPVRVHLEVVKRLQNEFFNVYFLTIFNNNNDEIVKELESIGVTVNTLVSNRNGLFQLISLFNIFIKNKDINLINSWGVVPDFVLSFSKNLAVKVSTKHEGSYFSLKLSHGVIKGSVVFLIQYLAYLKINNIICVSEFVKNSLKFLPKNKLIVIPNGIDIDRYKIVNISEKEKLRLKNNIDLDSKVFISVGSLSKAKDPFTVIKGFLEYSKKNNGQLIILGTGPLLEECKLLAKGLPSIKFFGHVNNVGEFLALADYFVSSSLTEGCPLSVLEAMASGLPVILTNIQSHLDIVRATPCNAFTFPPIDFLKLKECMESISHLVYEPLQKQSRDVVLERFSSNKMAQDYQGQFLKLIKK